MSLDMKVISPPSSTTNNMSPLKPPRKSTLYRNASVPVVPFRHNHQKSHGHNQKQREAKSLYSTEISNVSIDSNTHRVTIYLGGDGSSDISQQQSISYTSLEALAKEHIIMLNQLKKLKSNQTNFTESKVNNNNLNVIPSMFDNNHKRGLSMPPTLKSLESNELEDIKKNDNNNDDDEEVILPSEVEKDFFQKPEMWRFAHDTVEKAVADTAVLESEVLEQINNSLQEKELNSLTKSQAVIRGWLFRRRFKKLMKRYRSDRRFRERIAVVIEIVSTERRYVDLLTNLVKNYLIPMRSESNASSKQINTLFQNVEEILSIHRLFFQDLEDALQDYPHTFRLGDVFLRLTPSLKCYTQYVNGFEAAMETIMELMEAEKNGMNIRVSTMKNNGKDRRSLLEIFEHELVAPVQRIPRYMLLLKRLIKNTSDQDDDHRNLNAAFIAVQEVTDFVNESKRQYENKARVRFLEKILIGQVDLRPLIYSGWLWISIKGCMGNHWERFYFILRGQQLICLSSDKANARIIQTHMLHSRARFRIITIPEIDQKRKDRIRFNLRIGPELLQFAVESRDLVNAWINSLELVRSCGQDDFYSRLYHPHRRTVMESILEIIEEGTSNPIIRTFYCILFNDILLVTKKISKNELVFENVLHLSQIQNIETFDNVDQTDKKNTEELKTDNHEENRFHLISTRGTWICFAKTTNDFKNWIRAFDTTLRRFRLILQGSTLADRAMADEDDGTENNTNELGQEKIDFATERTKADMSVDALEAEQLQLRQELTVSTTKTIDIEAAIRHLEGTFQQTLRENKDEDPNMSKWREVLTQKRRTKALLDAHLKNVTARLSEVNERLSDAISFRDDMDQALHSIFLRRSDFNNKHRSQRTIFH